MNALSRLLARFTFLRWMALLGLMLGFANIAYAQDSRTICGTTVTSADYTGSYPAWLDGTAEIYSSSGLYLGLVSSNLYSTNSILNQSGSYGSTYATNSIFNASGTYGSGYGANSACTAYASGSNVPQIWRNGVFIGYLTNNSYTSGAIDTPTLIAALLRQAYGFSDITAPSIPTGVIATVISSTQINVSWSASQDNVAVTLYGVYVNGNLAGTFPASTTSISHTGLTPSTSYSYRIVACDAANNCSAQSIAVVGTTAAAAPVCTLTASPASITSGSSSTLTSSCSPAATSYVWTGGTCAGTSAATCTVTPNATTTYSVAGVNDGGTGTAVNASVTVTAVPTPTCTLTASPASITSGSSSTLTSSCSPAATSYVWTGGTCAGTSAATCTVTPTATTTYSVAGVNDGGTGSAASASVTVTAVPTPTCTLTASPASIHKNGTSTLTPTCSPAATSYVWTGGTCQGATASTCTVTPAATTSYSVIGANIYGPSSPASATVTVKSADLTPILMLLLD